MRRTEEDPNGTQHTSERMCEGHARKGLQARKHSNLDCADRRSQNERRSNPEGCWRDIEERTEGRAEEKAHECDRSSSDRTCTQNGRDLLGLLIRRESGLGYSLCCGYRQS